MGDDVPKDGETRVIAEVGGMVDKSRVSLAIYGDDLEPDVVSALLGCVPSSRHRKGDRHRRTSQPFRTGAWILTIEGKAPRGPDDLIEELLGRFPSEADFWQALTAKYRVSVRVGIHTGGWNRGFDLRAKTIAALAKRGIGAGFDLYFYGDEAGRQLA